MQIIKNHVLSVLLFFGLMLGFTIPAHAALPLAATTAFSDLQTDVLALVDLAWTTAIPITIAFIVLGMFSRAARSGTS